MHTRLSVISKKIGLGHVSKEKYNRCVRENRHISQKNTNEKNLERKCRFVPNTLFASPTYTSIGKVYSRSRYIVPPGYSSQPDIRVSDIDGRLSMYHSTVL